MKRLINAIKKIRKKRHPSDLAELDELYRLAVSKLPNNNRIDYCERLIERTNYEIKSDKMNNNKQQLKKLIQAAEKEIKKLNEHG